MTNLNVNDASGVQRPIAAETNDDGSLSPRHGLSDTATALQTAIKVASEATRAAAEAINAATAAIRAASETTAAATDAMAPAAKHASVMPSDTTVLTGVVALHIGMGGAVVVEMDGVTASYLVQGNTVLPVKAQKVLATGTTAAEIVALIK
ncbi:hypothetical protein FJU08_12695 [Martelella alba]|uniref:Uncharacterized protein n=1 Tax=Martelella alba TaxID=2590451 RepID=A0A506U5M2_9HYPH|nr:hypothetical protein [Martelella alba]TPW29672.1 hypothetical protein FJU08_12695 [Martelella alba]